jgi:hypothetical protein
MNTFLSRPTLFAFALISMAVMALTAIAPASA